MSNRLESKLCLLPGAAILARHRRTARQETVPEEIRDPKTGGKYFSVGHFTVTRRVEDKFKG